MKTNRKTILVLLPIVIVMIAMIAVGIVNPKMLKEAPIIKWARQALGEDIVITVTGMPDQTIIKGPIELDISVTAEQEITEVSVNEQVIELTDGSATIRISQNGSYDILVTTEDGGTKNKIITISQIDSESPLKTKPELTATTDSVTATFKQTESYESGTAVSGLKEEHRFRLTNEAGNSGEWVTTTDNTYTFTGLQDGTKYYVQTYGEDNVGNASISEVAEITTEFPPLEEIVSITRTPEDKVAWTKQVTFNITVIGGDRYRIKTSLDGTTYQENSSIQVNRNETTLYGILICNDVESDPVVIDTVENVDVTPPADTAPTGETTANTITVTNHQVDDQSGLDETSVRYRLLGDAEGNEVVQDWQEGNTFTNLISQKNYFIQTKAADNLGNEQESRIASVNTIALPSGNSANINYNSNWTNQDVEVTITNPVSGFTLEISLNGNDWTATSPITFKENGSVFTRFTDGTNYGEVYETRITNIDKIAPTNAAPTVSPSENALTITNNQVDNESGIETTLYRLCTDETGSASLAGHDWQTSNIFNGLIPNADYYIQTKVTDRAGNTTSSTIVKKKTSNIPSTEGKISVNVRNIGEIYGDWTTKVLVELAITDETALAKYHLEVSSDGENYSTPIVPVSIEYTENKPLYTRFADNNYSGNGYLSYEVNNIDTYAPTTAAPEGETTEEKITITNKQVDNECGIDEAKTRYRLLADEEGTQVVKDWQASNEFTGLTANTTYYMQTSSEDHLGNQSVSELKEITTWLVPSIDNLTLTANPPTEWTKNDVIVSANYTKTNFKVQLSLDGTEYVTADSIAVPQNGTVYARFINGEEPGEATTTIQINNIDKTAPSAQETAVDELTTRKIKVSTPYTDEQSGVKKVEYRLIADEESNESLEGFDWNQTGEFDGLEQDTEYFVEIRAEDNVGNISARKVTAVTTKTIDDESEEMTFTLTPSTWTRENVTVNAVTEDEVFDVEMSQDGENFTKTTQIEVTENKKVYARYTDGKNVGETKEVKVENIDKTKPTKTKPELVATKTSITATVKQTDNESGIDTTKTKYRLVTDLSGIVVLEGYDWQSSNVFENLKSERKYYVQTKVTDKVGNEEVSMVSEIVTESIPDANTYVTYEKTPNEWTNENVFITFDNAQPAFDLEYSFDKTNYTPVEEDTIKITENTTIYVRLTNGISSGKELTIIVNNIDKKKPTMSEPVVHATDSSIEASVTAQDTESGVKDIKYRLAKDSAGNNALPNYDWQDTGRFEHLTEETTYYVQIKATDKAGNETTKIVTIKTETSKTIITSNTYTVKDNEKYITKVPVGTSIDEFKSKITVNRTYKIVDTKGATITGGDIKTGYKLVTDTAEYEIAAIGDISGNGKLDITDLTRLRANLVGMLDISGIYFQAADITDDNEIGLLDLLRLRKMLVE